MAAEIIELPVPRKVCSDCVHAALSVQGVYCIVFSDDIWDEKVAEDCEIYEKAPE